MIDKNEVLKIAPESLPSITRFITSMREQKGKVKEKIQLIDKAIYVAKKQILYLQKRKVQEKPTAHD